MRDPRFLHVGISHAPQVDIALVDEAIESEALDWFRYSWLCYVVWTANDCETVCRKILRVPGMQDSSVFVCALDTNDGFGKLPGAMWEWFRKDRGYGTLTFWTPPDVVQPTLPGLLPPPSK